jgi:ABC-type multidrug transport system fused ATPase/permease subunit
VRHADVIAVLEGGSIVELGNHDELMGRKGLYRKLHDRQVGAAA